MTWQLSDRTLERVRLIDDDVSVRGSYHYAVEDLDLVPLEVEAIADLEQLVSSFDARDGVICDFNLKVRNYSAHNGDEVVAALYRSKLPVVLCSKFAATTALDRREIPVILNPDELSSETLALGFQACADEFAGKFPVTRKPWRTLVRIEGGEPLDDFKFNLRIVISAWNAHAGLSKIVRIPDDEVREYLNKCLRLGDVARVFAKVNVGAEHAEDLFICEWKTRQADS